MTTKNEVVFRPALIATLIASIGTPAFAIEVSDDIREFARPNSEVAFSLVSPSTPTTRFGMYDGIRDNSVHGKVDLDLVRRDEESGRWITIRGRNLALENPELRFEHSIQGRWGYFLEYNQTPRYSPYTVNTGLIGIGTANQTVSATGLRDLQLKTERTSFTVGGDTQVSDAVSVRLVLKQEEKQGDRLFGVGTFGNVDFLAEPIDATTSQVDLAVNYGGERLQLSGGYYGSFYDNHVPKLTTAGGTAFADIALPPDSEAHQLYVAGSYRMASQTHGNFKASYTIGTQEDAFISTPLQNSRSNLGGELHTLLVQAGLSSRLSSKLSVLGTLRYEDRDDKTPVAQYFTSTPPQTYDGKNEPRSRSQFGGKVEANYQLWTSTKVTGGIDYDVIDRNTSAFRSVSHRDTVEEAVVRLGVKSALNDTLGGSLTYLYSDRSGSAFLTNTRTDGNPTPDGNLVAPLHLSDRTRNKVRATLDWMPSESLSVQFIADVSDDTYGHRTFTAQNFGLDDGNASFYSLDATYDVTDEWKVTAWVSTETIEANQRALRSGNAWAGRLKTTSDAVGFGIRGEATSQLNVGADLQYSNDKVADSVSAITGPALPVLPAYYTESGTVRVWGDYAVRKNAGIRAEVAYQRWKTTDWTWDGWVYPNADGTTVSQLPRQSVSFLGVTGYYRWQ